MLQKSSTRKCDPEAGEATTTEYNRTYSSTRKRIKMSEQEEPVNKKPEWILRPMKPEDIDKCLLIWGRVELTEAKQTVASTLAVDPEGFYVAELKDTGGVIGMCSATMTRPDTAFVGFYAVDPDYQHIGIGRELWSRTLKRLDPSTNVGLYGVPAMTEKYKKTGFLLEDATRMLIYESEAGAGQKLNLSSLKDIDELAGCRLVVIDGNTSEALFKRLVDYDHSVQKFSRNRLLRHYLKGSDVPLTVAILCAGSKLGAHSACDQHHHIGERKSSCCAKPSQESIIEDEALSTTTNSSLSISASARASSPPPLSNIGELPAKSSSPIDIPSVGSGSTCPSHIAAGAAQQDCVASTAAQQPPSNGDYEVLGYGSIRYDNNSGGIIGPVYADSSDLCEVILRNLMQRFKLKEGSIYSVMALSSNKQACKILSKVGLIEREQCSRMFTKFVPAASFSKIYFVHSPNFTLF